MRNTRPLFHALYRLLLRRAGTLLLVASISLVPCGYLCFRLFQEVRADLRQLLPEGAPSVQTLREMERRFGGWAQLSIVIESPDKLANRRFSDDLVAKVRTIPNIRDVDNKLGSDHEFFRDRWHLFVDLEDLEEIKEEIEDRVHDAKANANPLFVDMEDEADKPFDTSRLEKKYAREIQESRRFPDGYFESPDGKTLAINVRRRGIAFALEDNARLVDQIMTMVAELDPTQYHEEMVIGLGGDMKNVLEEHDTLLDDLVTATIIVMILIAFVVVGYYRRWRAVYLLGFPVLTATVWTFAISYLLIGYLNASSAFLVAIVPGNGINFGLIMLARYVEERRRGIAVESALDIAVRYTARATITASTAAAIAYGSLMVTNFLGFKHFGIIGGIGMLLSWIGTFTLLPALIWLVDRRGSAADETAGEFVRPGAFSAAVGGLVARWPRAFGGIGVLVSVVATAFTVVYLQDPFEKDFHNLQSAKRQGGAAYWEAKSDAIFARNMNPQVILVDDRKDAAQVVDALKKTIAAGGELAELSEVASLDSLIPSDQEAKLEILQEIRELLTDQVIDAADEKDRDTLRRLRPPESLRAFTVEDLPESIRRNFRELDGTEGRVVLALPNIALNLFHADEVQRVADVLREIKLADGRVVRSSGNFVIFADMLDAVRKDGPKATMYSLLGVVLLTAIAFRRVRATVLVVGSLFAGVATLGGLMALWDIKINFLNFIALPITFGIGVDYAVNIYARFSFERQERSVVSAVIEAVKATGGAVALCSLTTIIGYGSLLFAHSAALTSFGKVAILGEFTCLAAAVLVMPAWMMLLSGKDRSRLAAPAFEPEKIAQQRSEEIVAGPRSGLDSRLHTESIAESLSQSTEPIGDMRP